MLSLVDLRRYRSDVVPEFRVNGGYTVPILASAALGVTMVGLGATKVVWSAAAIALLNGYYVIQSVFFETGGDTA